MQSVLPVNVSINGQPCSIRVNLTLSNVVPGVPSQGTKSLAENAQGNSAQVKQAAMVGALFSFSAGHGNSAYNARRTAWDAMIIEDTPP